MNATLERTLEQDGTFLDLVDFKWLMTGIGWRVDLSRLQRDSVYAGECVRRGMASDSNLLRRRSLELMSLLARSSVEVRHGLDGR